VQEEGASQAYSSCPKIGVEDSSGELLGRDFSFSTGAKGWLHCWDYRWDSFNPTSDICSGAPSEL